MDRPISSHKTEGDDAYESKRAASHGIGTFEGQNMVVAPKTGQREGNGNTSRM